jgi:hypothetical protein
VYRKNGVRQAPSTPSRNLYPAMIQLGRRIESEYTRRTMTPRDGNAYTEGVSTISVGTGVLVPVSRHLPQVLGPILILGADQKVCDFDRGIELRILEKLAHAGHDFADEVVTLSRLFVSWRGRNPENRDDSGVSIKIEVDGERVRKGVSEEAWDVVFVFIECHIAEFGEVYWYDSSWHGG